SVRSDGNDAGRVATGSIFRSSDSGSLARSTRYGTWRFAASITRTSEKPELWPCARTAASSGMVTSPASPDGIGRTYRKVAGSRFEPAVGSVGTTRLTFYG